MYLDVFFFILVLNALLAISTFGLVLVALVVTTRPHPPAPFQRSGRDCLGLVSHVNTYQMLLDSWSRSLVRVRAGLQGCIVAPPPPPMTLSLISFYIRLRWSVLLP